MALREATARIRDGPRSGNESAADPADVRIYGIYGLLIKEAAQMRRRGLSEIMTDHSRPFHLHSQTRFFFTNAHLPVLAWGD